MGGGPWWAAVHGVAKSQTRLSGLPFTFHFHALEKKMATHSSVLAWRIPGMGEPGGLPSMGSHRVGHDWIDLVAVVVASDTIGSVSLENPNYGRWGWGEVGELFPKCNTSYTFWEVLSNPCVSWRGTEAWQTHNRAVRKINISAFSSTCPLLSWWILWLNKTRSQSSSPRDYK